MKGGDKSLFALLETGSLNLYDFGSQIQNEFHANGILNFNGQRFARLLTDVKPREKWLNAIKIIRSSGLKTATITNNFIVPDMPSITDTLRDYFDIIIESAKVGIRKPDPNIYIMALNQLNLKPEDCIFLDDLGHNLKSAKKLGITTIKVGRDHLNALKELEDLIKVPLLLEHKL